MKSRGFTLIELLVSLSIFALIITGLTIALIQQQRQFKLTQEAIDLDQTARITLDYLATEVRNATSRQGKTFSIQFTNGGSGESPQCSDNTGDAGSADAPPDCLTVYTWDIGRGQNGNNLPSVASGVQIVSAGPPMVLQLPQQWFPSGQARLLNDGDFLGFRSRLNLCSPSSSVNCITTPHLCTECSAILRVSSVDTATRQATINDSAALIQEENFSADFTAMSTFLSSAFIPQIASVASEMTIVQTRTFRIDMDNGELEMSQNGGSFQPISGGVDSPAIIDLQFVFNLQDADGNITKVGVPLSAANRRYPNFQSVASLLGREKDIRTVEVYIVVKSKLKPRLPQGGTVSQTIPAIADVLQRTVASPSDFDEPEEGFVYRVFSTTVYIRNMAREEFG
ncbi:MAG: prepilin-type N-terminal cleavage/methylation domain-containing protein [Deltaproteobacteria bacterium]